MYLNAKDARLLSVTIDRLFCADSSEIRAEIGADMLRLLRADYYASYTWSPEGSRFTNRVAINMADENLSRYEDYYQFHDPITYALQRRRRTTRVEEIMPPAELQRTEFYQDFLRRDGLHHGLNLFVYDGDVNIGDMRIWRRRAGREPFCSEEVQVCEIIRPCLTAALARRRAASTIAGAARERPSPDLVDAGRRFKLTSRELDVAGGLSAGKTDDEIAASLHLSAATVRTHLRSLYRKLNVRRRVAAVQTFYASGGRAQG